MFLFGYVRLKAHCAARPPAGEDRVWASETSPEMLVFRRKTIPLSRSEQQIILFHKFLYIGSISLILRILKEKKYKFGYFQVT